MSDIRQGVSPGANQILDLAGAIHAQRAEGINSHLNLRSLPVLAETMVRMATCPASSLATRREDAIHAAARLIAFVELADVELAKGRAA